MFKNLSVISCFQNIFGTNFHSGGEYCIFATRPDQTITDQGCLNPFIDFWSLILVEVTSRELFKPPRGVVARCENVRVGELGSFESGGCQDAIPAHIGTTERHMGGRTILATQKSGLVGD